MPSKKQSSFFIEAKLKFFHKNEVRISKTKFIFLMNTKFISEKEVHLLIKTNFIHNKNEIIFS